jgi:hypothetical protein
MTGLNAIGQRIGQANLQAQAELEGYQNPAATVAGTTGLTGMANNSSPNIPMSDSYNAAASSPVFPPAAQDQAAAVFGSNDERQGSTSGFKQEIKERIIGDLNSL